MRSVLDRVTVGKICRLRVLCVSLINYRYSNAPFSRLSFGIGTRSPIAGEVPSYSISTHRKKNKMDATAFQKDFSLQLDIDQAPLMGRQRLLSRGTRFHSRRGTDCRDCGVSCFPSLPVVKYRDDALHQATTASLQIIFIHHPAI